MGLRSWTQPCLSRVRPSNTFCMDALPAAAPPLPLGLAGFIERNLRFKRLRVLSILESFSNSLDGVTGTTLFGEDYTHYGKCRACHGHSSTPLYDALRFKSGPNFKTEMNRRVQLGGLVLEPR